MIPFTYPSKFLPRSSLRLCVSARKKTIIQLKPTTSHIHKNPTKNENSIPDTQQKTNFNTNTDLEALKKQLDDL
jgi:hypothetical protein